MRLTLTAALVLHASLTACGRGKESASRNQAVVEPPPSRASEAAVAVCDLDKYKAIREVHFAQRAIVLMGKPMYPPEALKDRIEGPVNVDIIIDRDGGVVDACAVNGPPALRKAAEKAALASRFKKNFGASKPGTTKYQRDVLAYLFLLSPTQAADEAHYIVVRPQPR